MPRPRSPKVHRSLFILGALLAPLCHANTYYVTSTGDDTKDGTTTQKAWKTTARVNQQIYNAGDSIIFEAGKSFAGPISFTDKSISNPKADTPVTIKSSSPSTNAIITGGTGDGIYIYNLGGLAIQYMTVTAGWKGSTQSGNAGAGFHFYTDKNGAAKLPKIQILNSTAQGFKSGGILIDSAPSDLSQSGYDGIVINTVTVSGNGDAGVKIQGMQPSGANSTYCHLNLDINAVTAASNEGVANLNRHSGEGIVISQASGGTIQKCVAHGNGSYSNSTAGGPVGIWCWDSKGLTFQNNESYSNTTGKDANGKYTPDGDGFDLDGGAVQCVMQYNYSHDNHGAGFVIFEFGANRTHNKSNTVRYNISVNDSYETDTYSGIWVFGDCSDNRIYNNSIYAVKHMAVYTDEGSNNWFLNNIFYCSASSNNVVAAVGASATGCKFINNDYYSGSAPLALCYGSGTYSTLAAWRTASGFEQIGSVTYGLNVNPKFSSTGGTSAASYKLTSTSPMINAGYNLTTSPFNLSVGTQDYFKRVPFPNGAYDIGAHEY